MGDDLMRAGDLTVEVRDLALARKGIILPQHLQLSGTVRHCNVGEWKVTLPVAHPMVAVLRTPGSGLIVTGPTDVLWSGPTSNPALSVSSSDPLGTVTISGVTDDVLLADALAYPTPTSADITRQGAHDTRTGIAETIMHAYVNANIGPDAPPARRAALASKLTLAADGGRGIQVTKSARFPQLMELLSEIATVAGLGFRIVQRGQGLVFEVYEVADLSRVVRFDIDNGTLTSQAVEQSPPVETHVIVAGQGDLADRTLIERTSERSLAGMVEWGRRREVFKDQRQTDDLTELTQAGDTLLEESGFTATSVKAVPSDDQTMLYGIDWHQGDKISVVIDAQETASAVTEVTILADTGGVKVGASIGDVTGFDPATARDRQVSDVASRLSSIERNDSSRVCAGMITMMAGITIPAGWLLCDGRAVSRTEYPALYAAIGITYGAGDGSTTFALPSMKGRVPVGIDTADANFNSAGKTGGAKTHTLSTAEMPAHTHTQNAHTHTITGATVQGASGYSHTAGNGAWNFASLGSPAPGSTTATNIATGGSGAHNNLPPYLTVNFFIAT
jgi:microcystin-dependent protein